PLVQWVGEPGQIVKRLAIVCGAGGEFLSDCRSAHVDGFLTGEMRFHDYLAALSFGIGLILPGHYATERCGVEELAGQMQKDWPELTIWPSRRERDPVQVVTAASATPKRKPRAKPR